VGFPSRGVAGPPVPRVVTPRVGHGKPLGRNGRSRPFPFSGALSNLASG
jgi:hypothetical protein